MNKIFKGVMLSLLAMAGLASCSDDYDYTSADAPTGAQVYFPTSNPTTYTLSMSDDIQTINVPIERANTADAITVGLQLTVAQNSAAFSIPSQVSFAAGESETTVPLSYDANTLGYESTDTLYITIADDYATSYGISAYKCIVNLPSPLKLLGTGTFVEGFWYEGKNDVKVYQNELNPNLYRVMNPFNEMTEGDADGSESPYIDITILQPGATLAGVQITQKDLIYYAPINTGYFHSTYEDYVYLYHPAHFTKYATEDTWSHNKVVEWQENGLPGRIQLAPYYYIPGVGGWDYATADGLVYIDFPGYEPKDLSSELSYSGIFTSTDETVYAVGDLKLGADVKTAKAVVVGASADDAAVADAIASGDLEAVSVEAGRIEVPIAEGLTGKLQIVVAVLDGKDVRSISSANFEYYGGGKNPWESLGMGYLTDNFVITMYLEDPETESVFEPKTYEVEIQENTDEPGVYRLVDAFKGVTKYLPLDYTSTNVEVNAEDPDGVYILAQSTGLDDGEGEIGIATYGGYLLQQNDFETVKSKGYLGKLTDGVIKFPHFKTTTGLVYQGLFIQGSAYYAGTDGDFQIVLPGASKSVMAKAKSLSRATDFANRLNAYHKKSATKFTAPKRLKAPIERNVTLR